MEAPHRHVRNLDGEVGIILRDEDEAVALDAAVHCAIDKAHEDGNTGWAEQLKELSGTTRAALDAFAGMADRTGPAAERIGELERESQTPA